MILTCANALTRTVVQGTNSSIILRVDVRVRIDESHHYVDRTSRSRNM